MAKQPVFVAGQHVQIKTGILAGLVGKVVSLREDEKVLIALPLHKISVLIHEMSVEPK